MSEELKPCPFCGAAARYFDHGESQEVACSNTNCTYLIAEPHSKLEAIGKWNTRHVPDGYVLLPVVPTEELLDALIMHSGEDGEDARERYEALITVAKNTITPA